MNEMNEDGLSDKNTSSVGTKDVKKAKLEFSVYPALHCGFSVKDHGSISEIFHCHQSDFLHFLDQI